MDPHLHLHIDRLILTNIELSPDDRRLLQAAVETELTRLLTTEGMGPHLQHNGVYESLAIASITPTPGSTPTEMGHQIAHTIYQGINRGRE